MTDPVPLQSPVLPARHGFFTRQGGVSTGPFASLNCSLSSPDDPAHVAANRARVLSAMGGTALLGCTQVHGADVATVTEPWQPGQGPRADAMVTDRPGLVLGVITADCTPVLLHDAAAGVIGAVHAGWKGALGGVIEATVAAMVALGARRERIVAVLGPTIAQASYEVGVEFVERFRAEAPGSERFFVDGRPGHAQFDLPGFILARLQQAGVAEAVSLGLCTYADPERFYSYRRATHRAESDYGRLISAIALTP